MRWSKGFFFTLKEDPADAEIPSHKLMFRAGYIRKVAPGIFTYGPLALKAIRKFEAIVREELDLRGCLEILMPMVQPRELWDESGRWEKMGAGLQKMKNRNNNEFCLGATHEEIVTDYVRQQVKSYRDLPFNLYQIQTKFRDEIRPRFGLLRGREFLMKDAYSFDVDSQGAQASYQLMREAYSAIFKRLGVDFRIVQADTGQIGGHQSEEFHILAEVGEDQLLVSDRGEFAANREVCPARESHSARKSGPSLSLKMEKFATPGLTTIASLAQSLKIPAQELVKTMFFSASDDPKQIKPIAVLLRGSDEVNPIKLKNFLKLSQPPLLLTDEEVHQLTGARPGSCGPVGLRVPIYLDHGVEGMTGYIVGANEDGYHLKNVDHHRDFQPTDFADLRMACEGDLSPDGGRLKAFRGIEVGHIFYLGTQYSQAMKAQFLSASGQLEPMEMGCYGIGISRTIQAVIEQSHDRDGIVWPLSLAPFQVHICLLDPQEIKVKEVAETIYQQLLDKGIEVLLDDREERPGIKFKDADLLGMPLRLNVGGRSLSQGELEVVERLSKTVHKISVDQSVAFILDWINKKNRTNSR